MATAAQPYVVTDRPPTSAVAALAIRLLTALTGTPWGFVPDPRAAKRALYLAAVDDMLALPTVRVARQVPSDGAKTPKIAPNSTIVPRIASDGAPAPRIAPDIELVNNRRPTTSQEAYVHFVDDLTTEIQWKLLQHVINPAMRRRIRSAHTPGDFLEVLTTGERLRPPTVRPEQRYDRWADECRGVVYTSAAGPI